MTRANRCFFPGSIWHITHRCHKKEFLLKFAKDRKRWLYWLFQAKKRYGLRILNYAIVLNHIHLLVMDCLRRSVIPSSMDLISGRVAQEFNNRKDRVGAFWQDRYHATAIESGEHLRNCMVYIDLNIVRAGVKQHPGDWPFCGYYEIGSNRRRHNLIDWPALTWSLGMPGREAVQGSYPTWIAGGMSGWAMKRDARWTESLAVGSREFVEASTKALGVRGKARRIEGPGLEIAQGTGPIEFVLREAKAPYKRVLIP